MNRDRSRAANLRVLTIGSRTVAVEVARTSAELAAGLSGRRHLQQDEGMLFLYDEPLRPAFWMKGMHVPIDIVWLSGGKVIGIEAQVQADGGARRYWAPADVDAVLELGTGQATALGLELGMALPYQP